MQTNDLFEYRDKVIDVFKDGTFLSEYLKNKIMLFIIMC